MKKFTFLLFILVVGFTINDVQKEFIILNWQFIDNPDISTTEAEIFSLDNAVFIDAVYSLPVFSKIYSPADNEKDVKFILENPVFEEQLSDSVFATNPGLKEEIQLNTSKLKSGNDIKLQIQITPLIKKENKILRLKSFELKQIPVQTKSAVMATFNWKNESVLKSGKWLKISTSEKGFYKIPYSKLSEWGFSNPAQVKIFGSGGLQLSENPGIINYDDLPQVAIWHGKNNGADCLFFYEPGTTKWQLSPYSNKFEHRLNDYSTKGYFFLTEDAGTTKNPEVLPEIQEPATHKTITFDAYDLYEVESFNIIPGGSGKQWFGDKFVNGTTKNLKIDINDLADQEKVFIRINAAARSSKASEMPVVINQTNAGQLDFSAVNVTDATGLHAYEKEQTFTATPQNNQLNFVLKYLADNSNSEAWLDYIEFNYRKKLKINGEVLFFRNKATVGDGNILEFSIENSTPETKVFDVTDVQNIKQVPLTLAGSVATGKQPAGELREYAAFNPNGNFPEPVLVGEVANQNLHAMKTPEFLIITHPSFLKSANSLADFHRSHDGMSVEVVDANHVYNEFSSGTKNATGIRNFIKMLYDRGSQLKYVLLFGDGSYDNKNVNPSSSNFIPTYQSQNSLVETQSFVTDDYFVLLDEDESVYNGAVDLGIGRIPASTAFQAELVVNKIHDYYSPEALGNWRNVVCFIGDDEDGNEHMENSEKLANQVNQSHREFIIDKIYFDAFVQEATAAEERYPGVTEAINNRVKDGVLILNYVGHANPRFLSEERVLDVSNINSWSNSKSLPIFVTATCEFSRFDADVTSAGEYILFNPSGGGIALFSTTRVVFSNSNFSLSREFYKYVFERNQNGEYYRIGDIMRLAKTNTINTINKRNFSLLADPALRLSYPEYKVVTTSINQKNTSEKTDTVGSLQKVTVTGYVADRFNNKMNDFNGKVVPTVYDKAATMKTLGNANETPMSFKVQENVVYKGLASVTNGEFTFSFVIPKDISYNLGEGKIVYYAENGAIDANGAFENFYIGGTSSSQIADNEGPDIDLYLDSPSFKPGERTSKNPTLVAVISDENGINTVGTGIGHDITAVLDNDYSTVFVLNKFYQADIDDFTSGTVQFPLRNLAEGKHTLTLKVWDVANNSSEKEIEFFVTGEFNITSVSNYPNPVYDYTFFTFEHNQSDASLKTIFEIFDQNGRRIDFFTQEIGSNGTLSNPVRWDLKEINGALKNGVYIYRVTAQNNDGIITSKSGKMIIAH